MSDPLLVQTEARERELFQRVVRELAGAPQDLVAHIAIMLLINAIRQATPSLTNAMGGFDALAAQARRILADHYDAKGRKRGIFPYDQVITVPRADLRGTSH